MSDTVRPLHPVFRLIAGAVAALVVGDEIWDLVAGPTSPIALHIGRIALATLFGYVALTGVQIVLPPRGQDL